MRYVFIALSMLLFHATPAQAQVSVGIGMPGIDIGINVPVYPDLVPVPGYPVYYDPRGDSNYFFYDGMYWVYRGDNWYASNWYNGPWQAYGPEDVPLFVLRVPVRYYRQPPAYFQGWGADAPPRWGEHWGRGWKARRSGWDQWDHRTAPRAAPLPAYQARYSGDRYPRAMEQQQSIRTQNYHYQPREAVTRAQSMPRDGKGPNASAPVAERPRPSAPSTSRTPTLQMQQQPKPRPSAPSTSRTPTMRVQQQPQPQRVQQQSPGPRSTPSKAEPSAPAHEAQRVSSAPQQHPRNVQRGQEGKEEGRGQEHR